MSPPERETPPAEAEGVQRSAGQADRSPEDSTVSLRLSRRAQLAQMFAGCDPEWWVGASAVPIGARWNARGRYTHGEVDDDADEGEDDLGDASWLEAEANGFETTGELFKAYAVEEQAS